MFTSRTPYAKKPVQDWTSAVKAQFFSIYKLR
ncbi:MAG: hypothetical protein K0Q59_6028, partial [Paenibacillus sp.]|nr:hypothetical protein [Paenibacillus sp.]